MRKHPLSVPGIYAITTIVSGKAYVGQSKKVSQRWASHRWALNRQAHRNKRLQKAWNEDGEAAFVFEVIAHPIGEDTPEALAYLEREVLKNYPSTFNLMEVGEPYFTASAETRAKLSAERKTRWANPEYRARLKASHVARLASPEAREKHRATALAYNATEEGKEIRRLAGKKVKEIVWGKEGARERRSEKTKAHWNDAAHRAKQSESRRGAWASLTPEQHAARVEAARLGRANKKRP